MREMREVNRREAGLYWVRPIFHHSRWTVGEWDPETEDWELTGSGERWLDTDMRKIDEHRLGLKERDSAE